MAIGHTQFTTQWDPPNGHYPIHTSVLLLNFGIYQNLLKTSYRGFIKFTKTRSKLEPENIHREPANTSCVYMTGTGLSLS
jgi:hypothetical protein